MALPGPQILLTAFHTLPAMERPSQIRSDRGARWRESQVPELATRAWLSLSHSEPGGVMGGQLEQLSLAGSLGMSPETDWRFTVSPALASHLKPGCWHWQGMAALPSHATPLIWGQGTIELVASADGGTVTDEQSRGPTLGELIAEARRELADVKSAISAVQRSQEYRIGTSGGGRMVRRGDLSALEMRRQTLVATISRLQRKRSGDGPFRFFRVVPT